MSNIVVIKCVIIASPDLQLVSKLPKYIDFLAIDILFLSGIKHIDILY